MRVGALQDAPMGYGTLTLQDQVAIGQRQEYKKSHVMCDFFVYVKILL